MPSRSSTAGGSPIQTASTSTRIRKCGRLLTLLNLSIAGAGHLPPYGDTVPDLSRIDVKSKPENTSDLMAAKRLYERTADGPEKVRAAALRLHLAESPAGKPQGEAGDPFWLLFHQTEPPAEVPPLPAEFERRISGTHFLGQEGLALLRTGARGETAVLFRFGPSLNHGHFDDLGYNLFGLGYELTYDLGYQLANTHTQVGFAKQTTSHNLVVVDETSQHGLTGGSLHLFAGFPGVKVIEALLGKLLRRERRLPLPPDDGSRRRRPGRVSRRPLPRQGRQPPRLSRPFPGSPRERRRERPSDRPQRGSLAGPEFAWGSKQLNDGDMEGHPQQYYWNPPPGNGYGFLVHPRRGRMTGPVSAEWQADDSARVRMMLAPSPQTEIVTADAPGIKPGFPRADFVIARRQGKDLAGTFASVIEPFEKSAAVQGIENLPIAEAGDGIAARGLSISLAGGAKDYLYSALDERTRTADGLSFGGKFILARAKDGALEALYFIGGREFRGFGWTVKPESAGWDGDVEDVDIEGSVLSTAADLPDDGRLDGAVITFSNPAYSRTTSYRVAKITKAAGLIKVRLDETVVLGKGEATEVKGQNTLSSRIPHEYARSVYRQESGFFRGKLIRSVSGAETHVVRATPGKALELEVENASAFKPGETFHYIDIQKGDRFRIDAVGRLERLPSGEYRFTGTAAADIQPPAGAGIVSDR